MASGELSGMHSDMTSRAEVQIVAPFLISCKFPAPLDSQGAAGVASKGRFRRSAHLAVDNAPDREGACTTTTTRAIAAIKRFRLRNKPGFGLELSSASVTSAPCCAI